MNRVAISFTVEPKVHAGLSKRAAQLGYKATDYARMLFEAAYAARVRGERGEEDFAAELDRQVRQVFLLADCEAEFVAQALGVPAERVTRILDGWRMVMAGRGGGSAVAAVTPKGQLAEASGLEPLPPPVPAKKAPNAYSQNTVDMIVAMYNDGSPIPDIAKAVGTSRGAIDMWLSKHRDVCPHRAGPQAARPTAAAEAEGARP